VFINRCKAETVVTAPIANGFATIATLIREQDLTNFLFAIQFAAEFTHMESFSRIVQVVTGITNGIVQIGPFDTTTGPNNPTTYVNISPPRRIVISSFCNWNLIMMTDNHSYNGQRDATNVSFNL
jgi:hypothetical protein